MQPREGEREWDAFICHASEDKDDFVRGLAERLNQHVRVWYDEFELNVGDSLRRSIDAGLRGSRYGIVVLSPRFFDKAWPQEELDALHAMRIEGRSSILPIWLDVESSDVADYSPLLANLVAAQAALGLDAVVTELLRVLLPETPEVGALLTERMEAPTTRNSDATFKELAVWADSGKERWEQLRTERALSDDAERFGHGTWNTAYSILGVRSVPSLADLLITIRESEGRETGWPVWWVPSQAETAPYPYSGNIECWLAEPQGVFRDGAHSDFWRADPRGLFYLIRGYQEDSPAEDSGELEPGSFFDLTLPIWRVGECVRHMSRTAQRLAGPDWEAAMRLEWQGLSGRTLRAWAGTRLFVPNRISRQDRVVSEVVVSAADYEESLAAIVRQLILPLYEVFDFFVPPDAMIEEELSRLVGRDDIDIIR